MKHLSDDVFAASNPAFCALVLHYFLKGYDDENPNGADYPLAFLPIPILLSEDIRSTMVSSNRTTGVLNWITNNSLIKVDLNERVQNTIRITKEAILFGSQKGLLTINEHGRFLPVGAVKDNDVKNTGLSRYTSIARRFGSWTGQLNSTETLLYSLGISL